jgi:hypothetical protein
VHAGTGTNTIYALSPVGDSVYCTGQHDTVYAYGFDQIHNCATVIYRADPSRPLPPGQSKRYDVPSLKYDRVARRLYARLRAAERRARR